MFTVQSIRDPQWTNSEHTGFTCFVKFAEFSEEHPFGCVYDDQYAHSKEIWNRVLAGECGPIQEFVDTPQPDANLTPSSGEVPASIL